MTKTIVEQVKDSCLRNYDAGGDVIIECWTDQEIENTFASVAMAKQHCGIIIEQALNCRLGSDDDPELKRYEAFKAWK